jgi:hypothetical protein
VPVPCHSHPWLDGSGAGTGEPRVKGGEIVPEIGKNDSKMAILHMKWPKFGEKWAILHIKWVKFGEIW